MTSRKVNIVKFGHITRPLSITFSTCEFPSQRPVTRNFDVFLYMRLNKWLSKQSWGWWFEMPSCPLWRHCHVSLISHCITRTTGDLSLMGFCGIHLGAILHWVPQLLCMMRLKIILLKLFPHLLRASKFNTEPYIVFFDAKMQGLIRKCTQPIRDDITF